MREKYESLTLPVLRELAKARGMKGVSALKKSELVEAMLRQDEFDLQKNSTQEVSDRPAKEAAAGRPAAEAAVNRPAAEAAVNRPAAETAVNRPAAETASNRAAAETAADRPARVSSPERQTRNTSPDRPARDAASGRPGRDMSAERSSRDMNAERSSRDMGSERQTRDYSSGQMTRSAGSGRPMRRQDESPARRPGNYSQNRGRTAAYEGNRGESPAAASYQTGTSSQYYMEEGISRDDYSDNSPRTDYGETIGRRPDYTVTRSQVSAGRTDYGDNAAQASARRTDYVDSISRLTDADRPPVELAQLDSGICAKGILEVMGEGYGFIRSDNYLPGENDVYVSPSQIRKFNLRTGDIITGNTRIRSQQEKFSALLYLKTINGLLPSESQKRYNFEDMTPIFPDKRLRMERGSRAVAMRIVDLFSPIGKGQRGMIVSPPKAGKTTLLKEVARSILENDENMKLIILLIDERPEEVTDIKEAIQGKNVEVIYSTFDETPDHHKRVSEMVIERAKRLVEQNEDVTILLDSITRLARAYNLTVPPSGRTLSGGLDPAALHMPKRFFGAARNMREGGSLTILATALVDTGSKMDDVVYEEFKGTGNMELVLDRKLSEKRVFPAIDIPKSGTRREDLLLDRAEQEAIEIMRRGLNGLKADEAVESILNLFVHTRDNAELISRVRRQRYI